MTPRSACSVALYSRLSTSSVSARALPSAQSRVRRPRASGLHGSTPTPSAQHSLSISRSSSRYSRL
ncbi:Uncharacterised protein [Bordetella pertussis]|nr:Uncharacterised protein [Bordetella pertussis]CFW07778.1 Uncharacterised protein [Bordetella pertussis]